MKMVMLKGLLKKKLYLFIVIAVMIVEPAINAKLNFWLQKIFNMAVPGGVIIFLLRMLTFVFLIWMLKRLIVYSGSVVRIKLICDVKQELKNTLFEKFIRQDVSKIVERGGSGQYVSVFTNDIVILEQHYYKEILSLISNIIAVLILSGSFMILNWKIGISIISFGIVALTLVPLAFHKALASQNLKYSESLSVFTQRVKEFFEAYATIKNYSIENEIGEGFYRVNQKTEEAKYGADTQKALADNTGSLLSWFMQFIAVGFGLVLVIKGEILVGTVVASQSFSGDLARPLQEIVVNINSICSVKSIAKKVEMLTLSETIVPNSVSKQANVTVRGKLEFRNVSLKIAEKEIIKNFSFRFQPNKKYLVIGKNGAGKSSLFKTVKKYYSSVRGDILLNDINIAQLNNEQISKMISYLNEKISLFSGEIRDNICLFRNYAQEEIAAAMNKVELSIDLRRTVDDNGYFVSSGEQRKIEIARSLLELTDILIMDEMVSTVDIGTAYEIEKMLLGYPDKTVIFISHNFSGKLIREYDCILIIEEGELVASGTYEELMRTNDYFKKICEIKFGVGER